MRICVMQCIHRSRALENLIEDWKGLQSHTPVSTFLSAIVPECIDVGAFCQQSWEYVRELLRTDPNGDEIDEVGAILKPELPKILAAFASIQEIMASMIRDQPATKDVSAFQTALGQVRELSSKVERAFPELDTNMAEESLAEFRRGDYQTIEELIREVQGHRAPVH